VKVAKVNIFNERNHDIIESVHCSQEKTQNPENLSLFLKSKAKCPNN
jgi:hypothetical protein